MKLFSIRDIIRAHILINGAKYKKIYKLLQFSNNNLLNQNEINENIYEGKDLAKEIGASFENINITNEDEDKDKIKRNIDNILTDIIKQMMECFNNYKEKSATQYN